jgi:hypothetical protein
MVLPVFALILVTSCGSGASGPDGESATGPPHPGDAFVVSASQSAFDDRPGFFRYSATSEAASPERVFEHYSGILEEAGWTRVDDLSRPGDRVYKEIWSLGDTRLLFFAQSTPLRPVGLGINVCPPAPERACEKEDRVISEDELDELIEEQDLNPSEGKS